MKVLKLAAYALVGLLTLAACSDDAEENGTLEQELSQVEVQTILETDEVTSVVDEALADLFANTSPTGRSTGTANECYSAEYTDTGFTATFNNCVLNQTENVNGTLTVTYGLDENTASFTATFVDFFVGTIRVNGTRTFTVVGSEQEESVSFSITSNISVEFENGETISENGTKTFALLFEEGQDTLWNLSGEWTVQLDGDTYSIAGNVSKNFVCEYWTMGSMTINKNGLVVAVDFGDGTCDNKATLTYPNGVTQEIDL